MKYEDFEKFIREKCMYETIYDDSDGRQILVIKMLDAYGMVNKAPREWVGLTDEEIMSLLPGAVRLPSGWADTVRAIEQALKEKNT
jgi:hypothetical protein